jgi:hypothetical protein
VIFDLYFCQLEVRVCRCRDVLAFIAFVLIN